MLPTEPHQPFWKDELDYQSLPRFSAGIFSWVFIVYRFLILGLVFAVFYYLSPVMAWVGLGVFMIAIGSGFYARRRRKLEIQAIAQIQQRARDLTGAVLIGSAVHVAGHPQLEREQKVVLALTASNLAIYSYEADQPLAMIPIQKIAAIHTVVYDDERVPHIDVVDSTAQALQLTLRYGEQDIPCLFRGMKKVRSIDWYHAIQKSRVSSAYNRA